MFFRQIHLTRYYWRNDSMKKIMFLIAALAVMVGTANAQNRSGRLSLGTGLLYERGMDLTLAYEYETKYHNSWEFFANAYLKWDDCSECNHICPKSFWNNYNSYGFGVAYN